MNKADCGWREEEVIDFVMGKLTGEKADLFGQHIVQCEHCSALYREWTPLLTETPAPALPTVSAPSPALKKRLLRRIVLDSWLSSLVRRLRSIYTVPATVAVVLLLLLFAGLNRETHLFPDANLAAKEEIFKEREMFNDPNTVLHQAMPALKGDVKGYVWINDASDEMLFLAEGLDHLQEKDYQVWFVINNNRSNVGVLQWKGRMAHLYFHGGTISEVENIAVSIEPKGGSFSPTGPDTMFVQVRREK